MDVHPLMVVFAAEVFVLTTMLTDWLWGHHFHHLPCTIYLPTYSGIGGVSELAREAGTATDKHAFINLGDGKQSAANILLARVPNLLGWIEEFGTLNVGNNTVIVVEDFLQGIKEELTRLSTSGILAT